jgi:hypothetical protein
MQSAPRSQQSHTFGEGGAFPFQDRGRQGTVIDEGDGLARILAKSDNNFGTQVSVVRLCHEIGPESNQAQAKIILIASSG